MGFRCMVDEHARNNKRQVGGNSNQKMEEKVAKVLYDIIINLF